MNELTRLMVDHSSLMMLLVEPAQCRIIVANLIAQQMLGYSEETLLGMTITDVESSLQDIFYWEEVRQGQCHDITAQDSEYHRADGSILTVSKSVKVIQHDAGSFLLVQARSNQAEHKVEEVLAQTLSQLRATLESTGNGILVIDWQGNIASMNHLLSSMWKIPDALLQARNDASILAFIAQSVIEGDVLRARLQEIVDSKETEDLFRLKDGRILDCRSRPQYLGDNIIGRVFGFSDITARTLAEEAVRDARDVLEERVDERTADLLIANQTLLVEKDRQEILIRKLEEAQNQLLQSEKMASIGQLAAGVAHEINNPIGFVNSNLGSLQHYIDDLLTLLGAYEGIEGSLADDLLQEILRVKKEVDLGYLREDIGNLLSESLDGLQRVKQIVQDLKDFSHVDEAERQWANLESGLDSTLRVVWNELKYKVEVVKEYGNIPQIECLPSQLNQVFMNLLINAVHAIDDHGQITIRTGQANGMVWVEVEDTGKGIKPEHLGRIFEPFYTTKPVGMGTGLGLSLSYGIVQKHGGKITVRSELGKGSVFKVVLPESPVVNVVQMEP